MEKIRILIADDHPRFREGLQLMLRREPDLEVIGEASSGEQAVAMAEAGQPDIILMDLHMPGLHGVDATRRIMETSPHIRVLVITMYEDDDTVFAALRAGARGYLLKGADKAEVLRAIRGVASGEAIFGPAIAHRLMQYFATQRPSLPQRAFPELTEREHEVLTLIAKGWSNGEIAARLVVSLKTVRNHVSNIFSKLEVADRTAAILRARKAGLGQAED
jgi:DNA-binding NarL/FixJ family response regulator